MDALISAVSNRIAFVDGNQAEFLNPSDPIKRHPISLGALNHLFSDSYDFELIQRASEREAYETILRNWYEDKGLRMLHIALDATEPHEIRRDAISAFDSMLREDGAAEIITNWLLATPVYKDFNLDELIDIFSEYEDALDLLLKLDEFRTNIDFVRREFDNIPDELFGSQIERKSFELAAIKTGVFKNLVLKFGDKDQINGAVIDAHTKMVSEPNARSIIVSWTSKIKTIKARRLFNDPENESDDFDYEDHFESVSPYEAFQYVKQQKTGIVKRLSQRAELDADFMAEKLVSWQLQHGKSSFAAKSLCDLSQKAKSYGLHNLQLKWAVRATQIAPNDSYAQGTAADANLHFFRFDEALEFYRRSEELGDRLFALNGQARVCRAQGKYMKAISIFMAVVNEYEFDEKVHYSWSGYAECLRDIWKYEEALEVYSKAVQRFPDIPLLHCGRAAVLTDLGELEEAKEIYEATKSNFPDEPVPYSGEANVLKLMGEFDAALELYKIGVEKFPEESVMYCGMADVYREKGEFSSALKAYNKAKHKFPFAPIAFSGLAETHRSMARFDDAVEAYADAISRFRFDPLCRNGHANILKLSGRYEDSLRAYDENSKMFPDDLVAKHGRADLLKLLGQSEGSLSAYTELLELRPNNRRIKSSIAALHLIMDRHEEAEKYLNVTVPRTRDDWVAFHIKGMRELRMGRIDEAISIFEEGVERIPFAEQRNYFVTALATAVMNKQNFKEAQKLLATESSIPNIYQKYVVDTLRLHCLFESGDSDKAIQFCHEAKNDNVPEQIGELRTNIIQMFSSGAEVSDDARNQILAYEQKLLLQAA